MQSAYLGISTRYIFICPAPGAAIPPDLRLIKGISLNKLMYLLEAVFALPVQAVYCKQISIGSKPERKSIAL